MKTANVVVLQKFKFEKNFPLDQSKKKIVFCLNYSFPFITLIIGQQSYFLSSLAVARDISVRERISGLI